MIKSSDEKTKSELRRGLAAALDARGLGHIPVEVSYGYIVVTLEKDEVQQLIDALKVQEQE